MDWKKRPVKSSTEILDHGSGSYKSSLLLQSECYERVFFTRGKGCLDPLLLGCQYFAVTIFLLIASIATVSSWARVCFKLVFD